MSGGRGGGPVGGHQADASAAVEQVVDVVRTFVGEAEEQLGEGRHAVGTDHRPWLEDETGPVGVDVLRAVKTAVDPDGIMNPGVLVPPLGG